VVSALGAYKSEVTPEAAPVIAAIDESIKVIDELRTTVVHQKARAPRIKKAKHLIVMGLGSVILAYESLNAAFSDKAVDLALAKSEAEKADSEIERAHSQLKQGVKLLG
jgi:hypothetical protein